MDYEKKLKDALKDGNTDYEVVRWIESNFPELTESEDERNRKDLLNFLQSPFIRENIADWKVAPWIAFLEKQGKQNLANSAKTCKNEQTLAKKQEHPINNKEAEKACLEYRKFREECGIKDPVMLDEIEEAYYNGATSTQMPAWSEDDEEELGIAIEYLQRAGQLDSATWLKSLKERLSKR